MTAPTHLRVEHLGEALGITVRRPRLSWRLPAGARRQVAYQLRAGAWDSGRVDSDRSLLVPYAGPPLRSGERVDWTVRVWTDVGRSAWAAHSSWETGLLDPDDWTAEWIEPAEYDEVRATTPRPAYLLRGSVRVDGPVTQARLHATAHGIYEFFVNGHRVGDLELTPGFTSYGSTLQVQTYDVTGLLTPGENTLGAVLSDGWFRGQNGGLRLTDVFGERVALLAQVELESADGARMRTGTGGHWTWRIGPILGADLMQGQSVDLRTDAGEWSRPGGPETGWSAVTVRDFDLTRLRSSPAPPVRRVEELRPVNVTRPAADRQVFDLGQNVNGWIRLTDLGPAGTDLHLAHGETLDETGDVTLDNVAMKPNEELSQREPRCANIGLPLQEDHVRSAGIAGAGFEPRHTIHGFRQVRVEGHPRDLSADDLLGVVVHTDVRRTGWFACSDDRINRLHEAAVWSFRGNACDIPTDCPTRERAGWTGDWQIFVPTAAMLYDVAGFSAKWLRDLATEQEPNGRVLDQIPNAVPIELAKILGFDNGAAGWGDAAVIVPWEIHRAYDDPGLLAEQWPSMTAWVDYAARAAREHRHPDRAAARPVPLPHERYLWDTGFHWGEWLEPGIDDVGAHIAGLAATDHGEVATAYLHRSAQLLARVATLLDRHEDERHYQELADAVKDAWQREYIAPDRTLTRDTQAAHVRALAFDLAPAELRRPLAQRLADLVRTAGTHLGTGFLATPYLLPVLADGGHLEVAYDLLFQDTEPSWLTMIDRGATTVWELWDGVNESGTARASLNHYSKGAVISFLYRHVAGLRLLDDGPAYRRFVIAPQLDSRITWARAVHDSPYGRIEAAWQIQAGGFRLEVDVPPGTSAKVHMPDGRRLEARPGRVTYTCPAPR